MLNAVSTVLFAVVLLTRMKHGLPQFAGALN
jgi:hypothetical protein